MRQQETDETTVMPTIVLVEQEDLLSREILNKLEQQEDEQAVL